MKSDEELIVGTHFYSQLKEPTFSSLIQPVFLLSKENGDGFDSPAELLAKNEDIERDMLSGNTNRTFEQGGFLLEIRFLKASKTAQSSSKSKNSPKSLEFEELTVKQGKLMQ